MNQLLIALLISTSLAGVIQGSFVSSTHDQPTQVINQGSLPAVSKAMKDDLSDFHYVNKPVTETSSTIVQNKETEGLVTRISKDSSLKNEILIRQRTADSNEVDKKGIAEQAELKKNSKEKPSLDTNKVIKEDVTTVKSVKEAKNETETDAVKTESEQESTNEETAKIIEDEQVKTNPEAEKEQTAVPEVPDQEEDTILVTATAYTANCEGGTGVTYTGIDLKANPDSKVIAVDPSVIPLGTEVYVEGYGHAIAADIGGAIKGNKIDVFIPSESAAEDWGVKTVEVKILENE